MKKNLKSWIILSCCFLLIIIAVITFIQSRQTTAENQSQSVTLTDVGFDTPVTLQANCSDKDFKKYTKIVKKVYIQNNKRFDQYHSYKNMNNIYTLNHEAYSHPVKVDDTTLDCIQLAIKMNQVCRKFDISYGDTMNIWHTYREEGMKLNDKGKDGKVPREEEIQESLIHAGLDKIQINGREIRYTDPDVQIDLGGIAKGYTTELARKALHKAGLHNGFINAGGNVVLLGPKIDGSSWTIGVQSPDTNSALLSLSAKSNQTIVTSGDYQRYYTVGNKKYTHIIDIDTGYPASYCRSVSVVTTDSGKADTLSTSLFCLNYKEGLKLAKKEKVQAIWIFDKDVHPNAKPTCKTNQYYIYTTNGIKNNISLIES